MYTNYNKVLHKPCQIHPVHLQVDLNHQCDAVKEVETSNKPFQLKKLPKLFSNPKISGETFLKTINRKVKGTTNGGFYTLCNCI